MEELARARVLNTVKKDGKIIFQKGKVVEIVGQTEGGKFLLVKYRKNKTVEIPSKNLEFLT